MFDTTLLVPLFFILLIAAAIAPYPILNKVWKHINEKNGIEPSIPPVQTKELLKQKKRAWWQILIDILMYAFFAGLLYMALYGIANGEF